MSVYQGGFPYLLVLFLLPMAASLLLALMPDVRWRFKATSLSIGVFLVVVAIPMASGFSLPAPEPQFAQGLSFLAGGEEAIHLGLDGVNLLLVAVAILMLPLVVLCSWDEVYKGVRRYHILILLASAMAIGVYTAWDVGLLALCWAAHQWILVLLLRHYGGRGRSSSIVVLAQSFILLVGVFVLYRSTGSLSFDTVGLSLREQLPLFLCFGLASILGASIFPMHVWMGEAREEASSAGSILLASGSVTMGVYAMYRLCLMLTPLAAHEASWAMILLAGTGVLYCGLRALGQNSILRLLASVSACVASSSMLGLFVLNENGVRGALLLILHHALAMSGLLVLVHGLVQRTGTTSLKHLAGVGRRNPRLTGLAGLLVLSLAFVPGLGGFTGLVLILMGAFSHAWWAGWLLIPGTLLGASVLIRPFLGVFWSPQEDGLHASYSMSPKEMACCLPALAAVLWFGLAPHTVLSLMGASVHQSPVLASTIHEQIVAPVDSGDTEAVWDCRDRKDELAVTETLVRP